MLVILMGVLLNLSFSGFVRADMSSTNYQIKWDNVSAGGEDTSSSASYQLRDSVGEQAVGDGSSATYDLRAGYRQGVFDEVATFDVFIQYRNSQMAATALSGETVTVNNGLSFAVGDMILVVANEGDAQDTAMGRIESIAGNDLTVDFFINAGVAPIVDGGSDYIYELSAASLSMGELADSVLVSGVVGWEVNADVDDGYHVYVYEDHDLRSESDPSDVITDVSDGDVSSGVEYGGRSTDTSLSLSTFDTQDTAFDTEPQEVGSRTDNSFLSRDFVTTSVVVNGSVVDGTYSHTVTYVYVGDY